ncbi:hypothetical protein AM587_10001108 [Phytophthora nicotianae]|uniref:CCHC-type domain-containing protein n=1 Tax=Phytophthora nicotianae TaxID=4792 RepID=A0A0W8D929_PHYNI|nr:hypothetical protein AM587_10001108 [Phytophthora nicotianae]
MSATSQESTIKLDLASQFGHEKPEISIHFATLEEAGSFVRSYAFNEGKSVKRNKGTGNYKKWLCTSTAEECPWFVTLSRKHNAWYISKLDLQHSQFCNSVVEMTSKYLVEQPGFKAAIMEGHSTSMKRVVNNVKTFHGVDMQKQPALVYRAIQSEKEKQKVDPTVEYGRLPSFFQVFERNDVTPHAMKLFNTEKLLVALQTDVVGDERIFYVFDAFDSRSSTSKNAHVYEVNMYTGVCTRCTVSEQLRIPCRHIQAVIYDRFKYKDAGVAQYDVRKYFHSAYLVRHLQDAVESLSIQLPLEAELLDSNDVKPPPMYRQAGRSSTRMPVKDTPDLVRGSKRKQNRGEDASRSRYCGGEGLNIAVEDLSDEESKRVSAFFDTQLSAASVVKRDKYRCSKCGKNGHNKRRCNATTVW